MAYDFTKTHTAAQALQEVHARMIEKFSNVNDDVLKAREMQKYLQYFKKIFAHPETYGTNDEMLQALGLEEEAIKEMRTRFQQVLGVTSKYNQIFSSEHKWYKNRKDFDDIVEGELNALLQVVAEKATGIKNINLGQRIMSSDSAIVDMSEVSKELIEEASSSIQTKISSKYKTQLLNEIKAQSRPGKTDVKGYSKDLIITANITSEFQHFINLFTGTSFSIKNYKGDNQYQIHLGNTSHFKAIYGSLTELGYDVRAALHIYMHAKASYKKRPQVISRNNDIYHLRFMYELTGPGLIDPEMSPPARLDTVDFIIYNDPTSDKIFVKSTKEIIAENLDNKANKITNPWSGVYISKAKFY